MPWSPVHQSYQDRHIEEFLRQEETKTQKEFPEFHWYFVKLLLFNPVQLPFQVLCNKKIFQIVGLWRGSILELQVEPFNTVTEWQTFSLWILSVFLWKSWESEIFKALKMRSIMNVSTPLTQKLVELILKTLKRIDYVRNIKRGEHF